MTDEAIPMHEDLNTALERLFANAFAKTQITTAGDINAVKDAFEKVNQTPLYTLIAYRPNASDSYRGHTRSRTNSDLEITIETNKDTIIRAIADYLLRNNTRELDYGEWQMILLVNGYGYYDVRGSSATTINHPDVEHLFGITYMDALEEQATNIADSAQELMNKNLAEQKAREAEEKKRQEAAAKAAKTEALRKEQEADEAIYERIKAQRLAEGKDL